MLSGPDGVSRQAPQPQKTGNDYSTASAAAAGIGFAGRTSVTQAATDLVSGNLPSRLGRYTDWITRGGGDVTIVPADTFNADMLAKGQTPPYVRGVDGIEFRTTGNTAPLLVRDAPEPPSDLSMLAKEVHSVLDPTAQERRTTAALSTWEGKTIVGGSVRDLTPAQRAVAEKLGAIISNGHAERTVLKQAMESGLTPREIAATREICPPCQSFIEEHGGTLTSPFTAEFPMPKDTFAAPYDLGPVASTLPKLGQAAKVLDGLGRVAMPLAIAGSAVDVYSAYQADGGRIGDHTIDAASGATGSFAGAWGGAEAGAELGATVGTFVGGPVGTVVGGLAGGVIGGIAGSEAGQYLGDHAREWAGDVANFAGSAANTIGNAASGVGSAISDAWNSIF